MKDAVGNEILIGDILHVMLNADHALAKVVEVSGGMVVDPSTRKIKPETVRVIIDMTLSCPLSDIPVQFLPNSFKIHNPNTKQKDQEAEDKSKTTSISEAAGKMFLKRPKDIDEEKLNPTK